MSLSPVTLRHGRARLRPLARADLDAYAAAIAEDPDTWRYSPTPPTTRATMAAYIETALADTAAGTTQAFTIVDADTDEMAGATRLYDYSPRHQIVSIGYTWLRPHFRGTGFNALAKTALLDYCFTELHVQRVGFEADATNARSIRAMQKLGAVPEGTLRSHRLMSDGRRRDTIALSILRHEYEGQRP